MSEGADGPQTGPAGERAGRTGKPAVPRPVPSEPPAARDGQQRTERVPFPLPPLPPQGGSERPAGSEPAAGPETGRLYLGGYPPRVPGTGSPRREAAPEDPAGDDDGGRDGG
jgi:hypothetical protein